MENKKTNNSDELQYEASMNQWFEDEKAGNEFIDVLGKLFYNKSIELIFFRTQLIDRSSSVILYKHSFVQTFIGKKLDVKDTLKIAKAIYKLNLPDSKLDIGRLNMEWTEQKESFNNDYNKFVTDKLKHIIGQKPKFEKPVDVVLFGFGRIGRLLLRELIIQGNGTQLRPRAIVTRNVTPEDVSKRASLIRHDSIHGPFRGNVIEDTANMCIHINGHVIKMIEGANPEDIDYEAHGIHNALLIDNTGVFRDKDALSRHLKAKGIEKVILTAPAKGDVPNIVYGVNHMDYDLDSYDIWSAASCTTNAIVPALSVFDHELGIEKGHIETIHAYTNDQNLLDNYHKKPRRGRAAALNMVITSTGAGSAAAKAIPGLQGKLTANAVRVPTANVSLAILSLSVNRQTSREQVIEMLRHAALRGKFVEQIRYSASNESVSSDFIGDPVASIFDSPSTQVSADGKNILVYLWYDNEFGYTMQVIRLAKHIAKVKRYTYY
ncbi:MAG: glyceraldehyde-3-phosphate dehydrogenase [Bacteroidales bacterium]|nr:glyceraldehyde-3-phosphate dehydrogenase [Bacteroidales bacterium]MCF8405570.1 glyceraldehyde-3-phosphate dehydrogenase [Bacteroidales bacterium]